ncbi:glycosyltransferase [Salinivibrio kushneri]|uniref:glycosyltransferase n=1 Tax=Salinivibrio kushneri TaxID=1908198 RepID=UPI000984C29C|nr:glycosyltransferase [Salinivibrio kushneri]OOE62359.1 hypothetical protein BZG18_05300 [Salinivibrio kushneri]
MKIIVFNTLYYPNRKGGAEKSVQLICENLASQGHDIDVVSIWDKMSARFQYINGVRSIKWSPYNVYSVHNYSCKTSWLSKLIWQIIDIFNFIMFFKALCFFIKRKPNAVWTNNLSGFSLSVWVAAFLLRIPVFHTARDYYLLSNNVQLYNNHNLTPGHNIISRIKTNLFKLLSLKLSGFIGISDFVLSLHSKYCRSKHQTKIYNPIEDISQNFNQSRTSCRKTNGKVYGYIGQINEAKGVEKLIRHFLGNSESSILKIAGNDHEGLSLKYRHPRVQFVGFQSPDEFFNSIDILIVPSQWNEPFGRVVIESLAKGCPVLTNSTGGLSELEMIFSSVMSFNFECQFKYDINEYSFYSEDIIIISQKFNPNCISQKYLKLFRRF